MKIAVDLHIHSCLSPCADRDMTPNNLVNMAYLKGLNAIAVADHNCAKNLPACAAVASQLGIVLLAAMEVQSAEDVHVLTYFPSVEQALSCSEDLYTHLLPMQNRVDLFGRQTVMDEDDQIVMEEPRLLLQSSDLPLEGISALARRYGGIAIPAHVNKKANSLLYNLGFVPDGAYSTLEISTRAAAPKVDLSRYHLLFSSDAHYLCDISERTFLIDVAECSAKGLLDYISRPQRRFYGKA